MRAWFLPRLPLTASAAAILSSVDLWCGSDLNCARSRPGPTSTPASLHGLPPEVALLLQPERESCGIKRCYVNRGAPHNAAQFVRARIPPVQAHAGGVGPG